MKLSILFFINSLFDNHSTWSSEVTGDRPDILSSVGSSRHGLLLSTTDVADV